MKTKKKRAAWFYLQSEALQAPRGNQEEAQEEVSSFHSASDLGRTALYYKRSIVTMRLSCTVIKIRRIKNNGVTSLIF